MSSPPNLVAFLKELKARVDKEVPNEGGRSRASLPILAISETPDSFLIDSIVDANAEFSKLWPAKREFDEPALVEAFVALVTAAKTHDARLQKLCDKLVPKKTDELTFWRRYFAHVHALLIRLSPTDAESLREMARRLPPPRPLAARRSRPPPRHLRLHLARRASPSSPTCLGLSRVRRRSAPSARRRRRRVAAATMPTWRSRARSCA